MITYCDLKAPKQKIWTKFYKIVGRVVELSRGGFISERLSVFLRISNDYNDVPYRLRLERMD